MTDQKARPFFPAWLRSVLRAYCVPMRRDLSSSTARGLPPAVIPDDDLLLKLPSRCSRSFRRDDRRCFCFIAFWPSLSNDSGLLSDTATDWKIVTPISANFGPKEPRDGSIDPPLRNWAPAVHVYTGSSSEDDSKRIIH